MGTRSPGFRLTRPELSENDIERACLDLLAVRGYKAFRLHAGMARYPDGTWLPLNKKGTADYVAIHRRHPGFLLETKRPSKPKLREAQVFMAQTIRMGYGIPTVTAASAHELKEWLDQREKDAGQ